MKQQLSLRNLATLVPCLVLIFVKVRCLDEDNLQFFLINQTKFCLDQIKSYDKDSREDWCAGNEMLYPNVETAVQNNKICFTDIGQDIFNVNNTVGSGTKIPNLKSCRILYEKNVSCNWLKLANKTMAEDHVLRSVVCDSLGTAQKQFCLIIEGSRNFSNNNKDSNACLFAASGFSKTNSSEPESSILDQLKKHVIPIIAGLGGLLLIVMVILAKQCYNHCKSDRSGPSDFESSIEISPPPNSNEGGGNIGVYHEPNIQTQENDDSVETSSIYYEHPYGHLPGANRERVSGEQEENHSYINTKGVSESVPGRHAETLNTEMSGCSTPDLSCQNRDDEDDYVNTTNNDSYNLHNISYTSLNLLSMVNDNDMYQGLVRKKTPVRPKIAPKPGKPPKREEQLDPCYVKVL